jgi:hypothetical protein
MNVLLQVAALAAWQEQFEETVLSRAELTDIINFRAEFLAAATANQSQAAQ